MIRSPEGKILFTERELQCKGSGGMRFAPGFLDHLKELRIRFNRPMNPTSVCRSKLHNAAVGGHPRSLHVYDYPHWPTQGCCAIDIFVGSNIDYKNELIDLAWSLRWSVGIANTFVHLDRRIDIVGHTFKQTRFSY